MTDEKTTKRALFLYRYCQAVAEHYPAFDCPFFAKIECPGQALGFGASCQDITPQHWERMLAQGYGLMPADHLTPDHLAEIEARTNAATSGPWVTAQRRGLVKSAESPWWTICHMFGESFQSHNNGDSEFIAHSRADVPVLTTEVRRGWAEIERLKGKINLIVAQQRGCPPGKSGKPSSCFPCNMQSCWHEWAEKTLEDIIGKKISGRLLDGVEHNERPW